MNKPLMSDYPINILTFHRPLVWLFIKRSQLDELPVGRCQRQITKSMFDIWQVNKNVVTDALPCHHLVEDFVASAVARGESRQRVAVTTPTCDSEDIFWDVQQIYCDQDIQSSWNELRKCLRCEDGWLFEALGPSIAKVFKAVNG